MRRDAEQNRRKLLLAGRQVLQEAGGTASVERLCAVAGVTRATFYRHFTDRTALHLAILDVELDTLRRELDSPGVQPLAFVRLLVDMMLMYDRYLLALPDLPDFSHADASAAKIAAVIAPSLRRAQDLELIREDITPDEMLVACRMVASGWRLDRQRSRDDALCHRMKIITRGLSR